MKKVGRFSEDEPAIEAAESLIYMSHVLGKKGVKEYPVFNVKMDNISSPKEIIDMYNDMLNRVTFSSVASLNNYKEVNGLKVCGHCASKELKKSGFAGIMVDAPKGFWSYIKSEKVTTAEKAISKIKYLGNRKVKIGKKKFKLIESEDLTRFLEGPKSDLTAKLNVLRRLRSPGSLPHQKALAKAIIRYSRNGNKTFFSNNKIIFLITDDLSPDMAYKWASRLEKLADEAPLDKVTGRTENLKRWFKSKGHESDELWVLFKELDEKGCLW
jgi:hypothetical protein